MCFNMVYIGKFDKRTFRKIVIGESKSNNDGFFIESNDLYIRTLNFQHFLKEIDKIEDDSNELIHLHLRQRTHGKVNEENVHGWKFANWTFSHNGYVRAYALDSERSDSFMLFKAITNALDYDSVDIDLLKTLIEESQFYGVAFLLNRIAKRLVIISLNKSAKIYKREDAVIISNDSIDDYISKNDIKLFGARLSKKDYANGSVLNKIVYADLNRNKVIKSVGLEAPKPQYYVYSRKLFDESLWW